MYEQLSSEIQEQIESTLYLLSKHVTPLSEDQQKTTREYLSRLVMAAAQIHFRERKKEQLASWRSRNREHVQEYNRNYQRPTIDPH